MLRIRVRSCLLPSTRLQQKRQLESDSNCLRKQLKLTFDPSNMGNTSKPAILTIALLLNGCSQPLSGKTSEINEKISKSSNRCIPNLLQDGKEIQPKREINFYTYDLQTKPFRILVPSTACNPSIAETSIADAVILDAKGTIFTPKGLEVSGIPADQVLPTSGRFIVDLIYNDFKLYAPAVQEHKNLCASNQKCFPLLKAVRSYWPFTDISGNNRNYAEFSATFPNRIFERSHTFIPLYAVLYTSPQSQTIPTKQLVPLEIYAMKFNFHSLHK